MDWWKVMTRKNWKLSKNVNISIWPRNKAGNPLIGKKRRPMLKSCKCVSKRLKKAVITKGEISAMAVDALFLCQGIGGEACDK